MPSKAKTVFLENLQDVEALIDLRKLCESMDSDTGRKPSPEDDVVLRSSVVLLVTYWEAFVEDVVTESLELLVNRSTTADDLPKELRKHVGDELKQDQNDLAIWKLAGDGWRSVLKSRLHELAEARNRHFNTPKRHQTDEFVFKALGLKSVSKAWLAKQKAPDEIGKLLDKVIEFRGEIAHRGKVKMKLDIDFITNLRQLFMMLVAETEKSIDLYLTQHIGFGFTSK